MMNTFSVIEDAIAIVKLPKGVQKQTKMYHRNGALYVPHGGGYIQVRGKFDGEWLTSHPDVRVSEFECAGTKYKVTGGLEFPSYSGSNL